MQKLKDIMTQDVEIVRPDATLHEVADKMRVLDTGVLPVCDGRKVRGMITDRDIVIRAIADRMDPGQVRVSEVMTPEVVYCYEDQSINDAARLMQQRQIRRLLIVDRNKDLVGIISLGDLATETGKTQLAANTLEEISEPHGQSVVRQGVRGGIGMFTLISSLVGLGYVMYRRRPELTRELGNFGFFGSRNRDIRGRDVSIRSDVAA